MKYFVFAPTGGRTGGIECQAQLVDALRYHGEEAFLSFYPTEDDGWTIQHYKSFGYNISAQQPEDKGTSVIIVPEINTILTKKYRNSINVINWLSIDNYYQKKWESPFRDLYKRYRTLYTARLPIKSLSQCFHLTQSYYATKYLEKYSINAHYIGDYLNDEFFKQSKMYQLEKKNIISYNPKKGASFTKLIQQIHPEFKMNPLQNLTRKELINELAVSKIYIDFGHHPGRDRIPREAAIMNCCLITSTRGSAGNQYDIKINDEYKFKISNKNVKEICNKISKIFNNYETHRMDQKDNVNQILNDKENYFNHVKSFITTMEKRINQN
jgi:hypothetical protein